jgi:hypothetical protein
LTSDSFISGWGARGVYRPLLYRARAHESKDEKERMKDEIRALTGMHRIKESDEQFIKQCFCLYILSLLSILLNSALNNTHHSFILPPSSLLFPLARVSITLQPYFPLHFYFQVSELRHE